ncbi:protein TPRXL [Artemisia annua]|uniref:Protein TPRXL n=1 Tax=Artemisia annua TaxID=35608 RepID=A0A2U1KJE2_ARTAN|nr:protein TPRXL [Artemisia annua]
MSSSQKNKSGSGSPSIIRRSISPSGKLYTSTMTSSSPRSTSPNRITIKRPSPTPPSVRFTVTSPHRGTMTSSSPSKPSWSHGRSAMTNSLVRIGTVEGDLVKRALAALIRPSSHQQRRRNDFKPRPTRLSNMSKAED